MPRRDGFPTNKEMVADFNVTSHEAFVTAFEHDLAPKVPDAFKDKPLNALYLVIKRPYILEGLGDPDAVKSESLKISPISLEDIDMMRGSIGFQDTSEEAIQNFRSIADRIEQTSLVDSLDIGSVVPVEGIVADYTARYEAGNTRHIATFKEKPSKLSIASGKYFAERAIQHLNDPNPEPRPVNINDFRSVVNYFQDLNNNKDITHGFMLRIDDPDLPLNGHETKTFLNAYANRMLDRVFTMRGNLEQTRQRHGEDSDLYDVQQQLAGLYQNAFDKAQSILDKK